MFKATQTTLIIIVTLFVLACSATATKESTGEYLDSSAITAKVKAKLMDGFGAQGFAIKVKTYKDEVQLSGFVNNAQIKQRAGELSASVGDVKRVRNDLVIK